MGAVTFTKHGYGYDATYLMKINPKFMRERAKGKDVLLRKLKKRLKSEQENNYYSCPNTCSRFPFDEAFDLEFRCPTCGEPMNPVDNGRIIKALKNRIKKLEGEVFSSP